jgi:hypothetical protein
MDLFEYNLDDESTWVVREAPPLDSDFNEGLIKIAGWNRFGEQMLRVVWGGTHRAKGILVYKLCDTPETLIAHQYREPSLGQMVEVKKLADVPDGAISIPKYGSIELGELRWMIERWVSSEQLEHMGYFDESLGRIVTELPTDTRYAHQEFKARVRAGEKPETALARVEGELDRQRSMECDQEIKEYFDPEHRAHGDYQLFLKLERSNGMFHEADGEALEGIRAMWEYNENTPLSQIIADEKAASEARRADVQRRLQALWNPDNVLKYSDPSGAAHALWEDLEGNANAQIDFTL